MCGRRATGAGADIVMCGSTARGIARGPVTSTCGRNGCMSTAAGSTTPHAGRTTATGTTTVAATAAGIGTVIIITAIATAIMTVTTAITTTSIDSLCGEEKPGAQAPGFFVRGLVGSGVLL